MTARRRMEKCGETSLKHHPIFRLWFACRCGTPMCNGWSWWSNISTGWVHAYKEHNEAMNALPGLLTAEEEE